jgi:O-antigen/teichoic acid export membrane protein
MADLTRAVTTGIGWTAAARMAVRALGLLSTLIVARILAPADYGLVALATSFIALLDLATSFSFDVALIQRADARQVHFHTVWTLNLILYSAVAASVLMSAPWVARFYHEPRLHAILAWLALAFLVSGFQNTATVAFRKELDFRRDSALMVVQKLLGVAVTIPCAVWLRDYRALVAGQVVGAFGSVAVSFIARPMMPRLTLHSARELFGFSIWLLCNNFIVFLRTRGFDFLIGKWLGAAALGVFNLAFEIANLPSTELVAPVNRVVLPVYARLAQQPAELRREFTRLLQWMALIILPVSVGLAAVAEPAVQVLLGPKWLQVIPLMTPLALAGIFLVLTSNTGPLLNALGKPHVIVWVGALQVGSLIPAVALGMWFAGLVGTAWALALHSLLLGFVIVYAITVRVTPLRATDIVSAVWRPGAGAALMFAAVRVLHAIIAPAPRLAPQSAALAAEVALGVAVYVLAVTALWRLSGKPPGPESSLLAKLVALGRGRPAAG